MEDNVLTDPSEMFWAVWRRCARLAICDTAGGVEFTRVRAEWAAAGCPRDLVTFIRTRANLVPNQETPTGVTP